MSHSVGLRGMESYLGFRAGGMGRVNGGWQGRLTVGGGTGEGAQMWAFS